MSGDSPVKAYVTKRFRIVPVGKVIVDRYTLRCDPASILEIKPYGGRRLLDALGEIREDDTFKLHTGVMTAELRDCVVEFMEINGLTEYDGLWHDGWQYRYGIATWLKNDKSLEAEFIDN